MLEMRKRGSAMAIQWQDLWADLNERQRHFLGVMHRRECELAAYYNSQKAMFDPKKKGAEWRWMRHNGEHGLAQYLNLDAKAKNAKAKGGEDEMALRNNQGSGATYKALEERGLVERRWQQEVMFSLVYGEQAVSLLDVRLTPRGRQLVKTITEDEQGPTPAPEKRRELERQAWGKARFRDHDLGEWTEEAHSVAVAECKLCGQAVRVNAEAKKAGQIEGLVPGRTCGGWKANPKSLERQKAVEMGLDRLAEKLQEKRSRRGYRQIIAEMEAQGLDKVGACDLSRAEHGRPVAEDVYNQLCCWVGMTPDELREESRSEELKSSKLKAEEPKMKELPPHRGKV